MDSKDDEALIVDGVFYQIKGLDILKGAYLKARAGTITGLFGLNGSGKTTLLKVAAGQIQPNSGLTIIDGNRLHKQSKRTRFDKIAYLPQEPMLPLDVSVKTVLRSADLSPTQIPDRLSSTVDQQVATLSGGERRLLEITIVLNLERDYVVLDEPFSGVEPRLIETIAQRIEEAADKGAGVLITDHYHQYVTPIAEEAYVLHQKQCTALTGDDPIHDQLVEMGYIRDKTTEGKTSQEGTSEGAPLPERTATSQ